MADPAASWSWTLRESTEGILGSSDAALGRLWAMSKSWGASCKEAADAEDGFDIKEYMSTASVARDMLTIVERHAEWVAKYLPLRKREIDMELYTPGKAKLQYWGFSYGTFLGSTFASMFPERVGRVVLDGVVSSYDYLHSLGNGSLTDTHKAMDSFYTYCLSTSCPLSSPNATFDATKSRVENIVQSLYHNPLPINSISSPEILTYSDVKNILFSACYTPLVTFPFLVPLLLAIEQRSGSILEQLSAGYRSTHIYSCPINGSAPIVSYTDAVPTFAVLCGDGVDQTYVPLSEFEQYWRLLDSMSPTAGAIWSMLRMRCLSWHIKALAPFRGPFGGDTAHPVLFVSSTADPVTPLRSARVMHSMFPGSGLVVSDHAGHCSLSSPDSCTLGSVAVYFQTGLVPEEGKVCVPKESAWSLNSTDPESRFYDPSLTGMKVEEEVERIGVEVLEAGRKVARKIVENVLFGVERLVGGRGVKGLMGIM
jgi:pimeloyl-ACP methyl ester carboxylesterase